MAEWEAENPYEGTDPLLAHSKAFDAGKKEQAKKLVEWLDREEMLVHITNFEETCWEKCMACELKRQVGLE